MLAKDIREMSETDINARIAELERERFNLRLASGTRTLEDPLRLRVIRRDIARLNTVLREKIIGIAAAAAPTRVKARNVTGRRGRKSATATNRKQTSKRA
ncbi:MAG: 50S ribosomal protein L29 [Gemmatimonadaceae bacterium]|jgi:large subunit ribosomal protein L29